MVAEDSSIQQKYNSTDQQHARYNIRFVFVVVAVLFDALSAAEPPLPPRRPLSNNVPKIGSKNEASTKAFPPNCTKKVKSYFNLLPSNWSDEEAWIL